MSARYDYERQPIEDLIERSSLGTPGAKALRESVPAEVAQAVVERSKRLDDTTGRVPAEHPPIPEAVHEAVHQQLHRRIHGREWSVLGIAAPILWRAWTAGKAVVDLPEPGNGDDCWYVGESDIHGYQENGDPAVCHNLATLDSYPPAEARALAAALLAAADRAEQLADEHNAAQPDAEEVSSDGT